MSRVGLVVVSHSATLAAGVVEVAEQMAPNVTLVPAGGTAEGGIGTDFDAVTGAIERADGGAGVVVLYDLGSARMVAEMAVEMVDNARLADAPLVEGTVAAAVSAEGGADVAEVAHAAEDAAGVPGSAAAPSSAVESGAADDAVGGVEIAGGAVDIAGGMSVAAGQQTEPAGTAESVVAAGAAESAGPAVPAETATSSGSAGPAWSAESGEPAGPVGSGETATSSGAAGAAGSAEAAAPVAITVTITNKVGLHARPAAVVARTMAVFDAVVTVHFNESSADGRSVMALMALGVRGGDQVRVVAVGPQAVEALRAFRELAADKFGD